MMPLHGGKDQVAKKDVICMFRGDLRLDGNPAQSDHVWGRWSFRAKGGPSGWVRHKHVTPEEWMRCRNREPGVPG